MFINYMLFLKMKAMAVISVTALSEPEMTVCRSAHSGIVFPSGTKHRNDVNVQCLYLRHKQRFAHLDGIFTIKSSKVKIIF